ncbi:hypothetical protein [Candidatus Nitrotoga fabula]|uniref:Uncharacterized protein n=1 Tax=Candidatus Nitrotoga fabula TaxID=2182327 RepID=A0A916F8V2_9PROT|nr:hypothetical protein [Candidatus Nitrotoga fabula]CAE6712381.1 conserved membrane hypothetical protein [Candidatus Nitrotoga fabula]
MIYIEKIKTYYLFPCIAALIAFGIGYIHHRWFYPLHFHGDAAAMQVLARAILDEKLLLPADFSYGNQLIFLRSSPFIALVLWAGLDGHNAFVFGSSLSIAFWAVILFWFLSRYFESRKKGLLFSILLLIPLGIWEVDLILGQQSHLANVVLALGTVISVHRYISDKGNLSLLIGCICLFVMSSEAPIRGLLLLVPVLIVIPLTVNIRHLLIISSGMASSFVLAYATNKLLISSYPISNNYFNTLTFKSSDEFIQNFIRTSGEAIRSVSSLNTVSGTHLSVLGFLVFASGMLLVIAYFSFILDGVLKVVRLGLWKLASSQGLHGFSGNRVVNFVSLVAVSGVIVGAFAVSALNPDSSRHYLWAIFLVKFCLFMSLYEIASRLVTRNGAGILIFAVSLVLSFWFASLVVYKRNIDKLIDVRNFSGAVLQIKKIAEETGIRNVYGDDFWRMMPLNTLLPNIHGQALLLIDEDVYPDSWLTRPSWSCINGDVLYYLKNSPVDKAIKEKLVDRGGKRVYQEGDYALWVAPRVWQIPPAAKCFKHAFTFKDESLLKLPSAVGLVKDGVKISNGKVGFLTFGPYFPLKSGNYRLNVWGSSGMLNGSYVDVVSDLGNKIHAKFGLKPYVDDVLIQNELVHLSRDVRDIEVRVWVNENDTIRLSGYSLEPL